MGCEWMPSHKRPTLMAVCCLFSGVCWLTSNAVLSPRGRPTSGRTASGNGCVCASACGRRGRESEGARRVMPAARMWLRGASDPLCISCVRSSPWALMRPQQTMHHTLTNRRDAPKVVGRAHDSQRGERNWGARAIFARAGTRVDDDRQNITDYNGARHRVTRHDCRPSLRPRAPPHHPAPLFPPPPTLT